MNKPYIVVEVSCPTGHGRLVIDQLVGGIAQGGIRVAPSIPAPVLMQLARDMTLKCALIGMNCGGAKAGVEVATGQDPGEALGDFMRAITPYLRDHCLLGSDIGTTIEDVNDRIRALGLWPARKRMAETFIGASIEHFVQLIGSSIDGVDVTVMRNGWGVHGAARAFFEHRFGRSLEGATVAVQGFGKMGAGSAFALARSGARIVAIADVGGTVRDPRGLSVMELWKTRFESGIMTRRDPPADTTDVLLGDEDILVLGALEDAITPELAPRVRAKMIVCGANLAVDPETSEALEKRGIVVVPSVLGSLGTITSVHFGSAQSPEQLREQIESHIYQVSRDVLARAEADKSTTFAAATAVAVERIAARGA